jgi:aldehyde:ferredoxin oxidoreductase
VEGAYRLLQMVSHREGFGDVLAEGVKRASEKVGGEAAKCAVYTMKGASPRGHDHRGRWDEMLDTCTSSNGTMESANPTFPTEIGLPGRINPFDGEQVAKLTSGILDRRHFEDSLGGCSFTFRARIELLARALSAATGWTYTLDEAMRLGRRTAAILRAFNLRCGIGPELESPSARYGSQPVDGPAKEHHVMKRWEHMVDVWYETVGYDRKTGKPKPETLKKLGLDWLGAPFRSRVIRRPQPRSGPIPFRRRTFFVRAPVASQAAATRRVKRRLREAVIIRPSDRLRPSHRDPWTRRPERPTPRATCRSPRARPGRRTGR